MLVTANHGYLISFFFSVRIKTTHGWSHDQVPADGTEERHKWWEQPLKKVFFPYKERKRTRERNYFLSTVGLFCVRQIFEWGKLFQTECVEMM